MRPTRLRAVGFGSLADAEIDLSPLALAAIVGENGAGKSTLLDAVLVALYGSAAGSLDGFVRQGESRFTLSLDFDASGVSYRVVREYGKQHKVSFARLDPDGPVPMCEDKVREADAAIADTVGYDYATFTLAHWMRQGALGRFASLDPSDRKAWLASVLPMEIWPRLEAEAKRRLGDVKDRLTAIVGRMEVLSDQDPEAAQAACADAEKARDAARKAEAEMERIAAEAASRLAAARPLTAAIERERRAVAEAEQRVHDAERDAESVSAKMRALADEQTLPPRPDIPSLRDEVEVLAQGVRTYQDAMRERERLEADAVGADSALERARHALEDAERDLAAFVEADAPVCSLCGQPTEAEARERVRAAKQADAVAAATSYAEAEKAAKEAHSAWQGFIMPPDVSAEHDAARERLAKAERIEAAWQERERREAERKGLSEAMEAASRAVDAAAQELDRRTDAFCAAKQAADGIDVSSLEKRDAEAKRDLADARNRRMEAEAAYASAKTTAERAEADAERLAALVSDRTEAEREASDLALLVKAYGKGGIQARLVETAVTEIEAEANAYLARFDSGMSVEMSTQRENKTGGIRETLDILVTDAAGTRPLERMSGGETTRVNFALAVGLSRFLSRSNPHEVSSFVIDEPEYLDSAGLAELIECLHVVSQTTPLVLVVSHIESVTDSMPQKVVVTKAASGSRVEVVA